METMYKITVFTPTYNRAYIIEELYRVRRIRILSGWLWMTVPQITRRAYSSSGKKKIMFFRFDMFIRKTEESAVRSIVAFS